MPELFDITDDKLRMNFHQGQWNAWESDKRIVLVLAGSGGGKSSFGPPWMYREMQRRGPGNYLFVAPTYPLMSKEALPAYMRMFRERLQLGEYNGKDSVFAFSSDGAKRTFGLDNGTPTRLFFVHATDPEGLESVVAKAAHLDEAGQAKFKAGSWEAIGRRLAVNQGRILITTTPYCIGWLHQRVFIPWEKAKRQHPEIHVEQFDSTQNPAFPKEEFERARLALPGWKFRMFYQGQFEKPAGQIYDCFDQALHVHSAKFIPPKDWPRFLGLDFGAINTAGVFLAQDPGGKFWAYKEYKAGSRTAAEHVKAMLAGEPSVPMAVGGAKSEQNWRDEFAAAGLYVKEPPVSEVEVGIDRVYSLFRSNRLSIGDDLVGLLDEVGSYSREVDDSGSPTEKIADKETYHHCDALRYVSSFVVQYAGQGDGFDLGPPSRIDMAPSGVFAADGGSGYDVTDSRRWE